MNSAHSTSASTISCLGHDRDVRAAHEQVAALVARGDADVGVACLAGTVHDAAHDRDLQRDLPVAERVHRFLGDLR